ncbi:MAG TPA: NlpC/P60 family protein [Streptosporangiaceae bacterium]
MRVQQRAGRPTWGGPARTLLARPGLLRPVLALTLVAGGAVGGSSAAGAAPFRPAGGPGAVSAAAGQVSQRQAALDAARVQLARDSSRLAGLRVKAEAVIERYDKAMVNLQQAKTAYQTAQTRLSRARSEERTSRLQVARMAAQDYEAAGGAGSMATMLGNSGGPQAFMQGAADEQQLAQQSTDVLAQNRATTIVTGVFRVQARRALGQEQVQAKRAAALKTAIQAAIARQQAAVTATQASARQLEAQLSAAQAREFRLEQQAQAAPPATPPAAAAPPAAGGSSSWASAYSLSQGASSVQGNIAADWALTQLGKPYQWGGAGPGTYDCSGLTMDAWAHAGVTLLHWTGYQWPSGPHIPLDQLRRGDLLFYATDNSEPVTIHHVGIYIGNGQMVDAPYTGVDVRIDSIYQPGVPIGATRPAG